MGSGNDDQPKSPATERDVKKNDKDDEGKNQEPNQDQAINNDSE